jgi:exodeoxyribonuclease VII small subunit
MAKKDQEPVEIKFEQGLSRLEEIISILERGELGMEESIGYFREGSVLYKNLQEKLGAADGEIKEVLEDFEKNLKLRDLQTQ